MRSRSYALASVSISLALLASGCGDDDANGPAAQAPVETTPAQTLTTPIGVGEGATDTTPTSTTGTSPGSKIPVAPKTKEPETITALVDKNPDLQAFQTTLGAAGIDTLLASKGPYTVFAPNNDAFAKIGSKRDTLLQPESKQELLNILRFHTVKGKYTAEDLKDDVLLTTLAGTRLRVSAKGGTVVVGNSLGKATLFIPGQTAGNGIVYVTDTVLQPKS